MYSQPLAAAEGYTPDSYVTSDLVTTGRPCPSMIYQNMVNMDVFPAQVSISIYPYIYYLPTYLSILSIFCILYDC